jgi:hypothetical protein
MGDGDEPDLLTKEDIAALIAEMNKATTPLQKIKIKSEQKIKFFQDSFASLTEAKTTLTEDLKSLGHKIGTLDKSSKTDKSYSKLKTAITAYVKKATDDSAKQQQTTYYFGADALSGHEALAAKVKEVLDESDKGFASQAINDFVAGKGKDASVAGPGAKHCSSGTKGVGSCTLFFTQTTDANGMDTQKKVVAVGGHDKSGGYKIKWTTVAKLKKDSVISL